MVHFVLVEVVTRRSLELKRLNTILNQEVSDKEVYMQSTCLDQIHKHDIIDRIKKLLTVQ